MVIRLDQKKKRGDSFYTMKDKICLIRQPAGLGDILFSQKIIRKLMEQGYKIVWPVKAEFLWLKQYISDINFCSLDEPFPLKEKYSTNKIEKSDTDLIIPLQDADSYFPGICMMDAKYEFVGLSMQDWQSYLKFNRDRKKERELLEFLDIKENDKFVLLNRFYGSPPNQKACTYLENFNHKLRVIEMNLYNDFTLFDWCEVIERACEIHTVDTSIMYMMEKLKLNAQLFCYSRYQPAYFGFVSHLFKAPWNYVKS